MRKTTKKQNKRRKTQKSKEGTQPKPYFLVTLGVTGSGKGSIFKKIKHKLNEKATKTSFIGQNFASKTNDNDIFYEFLIDDLVESVDQFKTNTNKRINKKLNKNIKSLTLKNVESLTTNNGLLEDMTNIYFKYRKKKPCVSEKIQKSYQKPYKGSCDVYLDEKLYEAINNKKNIIFETQGLDTGFMKWLKGIKGIEEYKMILVWSIVDMNELKNRNIQRTQKQLEVSEPIRLPDIREEVLYKKLVQQMTTFIELLIMKKNKSEDLMKDTELMMIDNNSKESKIYSYENNLSEMIDILSNSFLNKFPHTTNLG
jgi:hypothetical protein